MKLEHRVAIVTGGGSGIGRAAAILFAREGAKVVITGRRPGPLEETAAAIKSAGGEAVYFVADVSKSHEVKAFVESTILLYRKIDILYNNAAVFTGNGKTILETSEEEWDELMSVNLKGTFLCSKYSAPYMIENGKGVIINCSSISGHIGQRCQPLYNASKGGIEMLTKCMALDMAQYNIRVNAVCPAWVEIDGNRKWIEKKKEEILGLHPIGRVGQPEDVANAILFLASDDSSWITGTSLMVDGGYTAQ